MRRVVKVLLPVAGLLLAGCCVMHSLHREAPVLRLIGDSTMADKPVELPESGWGMLFPQFFKPEIRVVNYAKNGRSTRSFINQGLWSQALADLRPGDYLFIQFGHNDAKISDTTRYAEAHTAYKANLIRFVTEARARGGRPLLITPVARRYFSEAGVLEDAHGAYPGVVKEVAAQLSVPLIDLHASSMQLLTELGPAASERLFMRVPPGIFAALPAGKSDNTHFMEEGAIAMARLVIASLKQQHHPLVKYLRPEREWPVAVPPAWKIPLETAPNP
ncbi:MAG TPA: rhamnogalacturonan acetylesterase [bacterium]|nr:rhamnogalacturonan acetylesterase [bacterium]